jgi:hypothetical protein
MMSALAAFRVAHSKAKSAPGVIAQNMPRGCYRATIGASYPLLDKLGKHGGVSFRRTGVRVGAQLEIGGA